MVILPLKSTPARQRIKKKQLGGETKFGKVSSPNLSSSRKESDEGQCDNGPSKTNKTSHGLIRWVWIGGGTFFVGLGIMGIFLPLLPTTPFLLLAAACYARGSKRFYNWLLNNRWFGNYIKNYREGKGIPLKTKILSISLLWATIGYSTVFVVGIPFVRVGLILIAIAVTTHILSIKTLQQ